MAVKYATKTGSWSDTTVWNGGALPGNGDTVYANNYTVTIDQNVTIGGANNADVNAGSLVTGCRYIIKTAGNTAWGTIGASSTVAGTIFVATGAGSGTGVATTVAEISTCGCSSPSIAGGGGFSVTTGTKALACDIRAGGGVCLTITGSSVVTITGSVWGGYSNYSRGVYYSSSGGLTVNGDTHGGTGGVDGPVGIYTDTSNATSVTINGSAYAGIDGASSNAHGVHMYHGNLYITGAYVNGGPGVPSCGVYISASSGSAVYSITAAITGGSGGNGVTLPNTGGTPNLIIVGAVTGGSGVAVHGIQRLCGGTISVTGTVTGGSAAGAAGIYDAGSTGGSVTVTGDVYGGSGGTAGSNPSLPAVGIACGQYLLSVTGNVYASATVPAIYSTIYSTSAPVHLIFGSAYDHAVGVCAISVPRYYLGSTPTAQLRRVANNGSSTYATFLTATGGGQAAVADVRYGVSYAAGSLTGTCRIPPAASVAAGTLVDNTVGTAVLTGADIPTAAAIAAAVRTNLATELGRIDTGISSRMATFTYTAPSAPPSASDVADAVRTNLAIELGRVVNCATVDSTAAQLVALG